MRRHVAHTRGCQRAVQRHLEAMDVLAKWGGNGVREDLAGAECQSVSSRGRDGQAVG